MRMEDYIIAHYANQPNKELAQDLGTTEATIKRYAKKLGLKKTPEQISRSHKKPQKHPKRFIVEEYSSAISGGFISVKGNVTRHLMQLC